MWTLQLTFPYRKKKRNPLKSLRMETERENVLNAWFMLHNVFLHASLGVFSFK